MISGIDFGAKEAGTTVIAYADEDNKVSFCASRKGQNADLFILDKIGEYNNTWLVFIDAPLSLPRVYQGGATTQDYFYREADRITGAMSPMFLGGLTARAMKIATELRRQGITVVETYPSKLAEVLSLKSMGYKGRKENLILVCNKLKEISELDFDNAEVKNWHYFDALLSLYSAKRYEIQASMEFGNVIEGTITV
ncbi:MAG: hypothetical protein CMO34_07710 [Verrucomicrobia bacterium]|nr:hypothetical protein [Verrucomicrobiota bacterium]